MAKLRGLAMVAAEAVATKFEHEAQLRVGATVQQQTLLLPSRTSHTSGNMTGRRVCEHWLHTR